MYSVCMRYAQNNDDANDIFQQAFYLVYKNIGQLKNENALSGWVKSIFVNTSLEHLKKKARVVMIEPVEHYFDENTTENWNSALSSLAISELTKLIQELPVRCQLVFNLYAIEGFTHKEIAKKLSISVGTSKSQLHDARKILKNKVLANAIVRTTKY